MTDAGKTLISNLLGEFQRLKATVEEIAADAAKTAKDLELEVGLGAGSEWLQHLSVMRRKLVFCGE